MTIEVYGTGKLPNHYMLVGEAPGRAESQRGKPFVGRSGQEQENYLQRHGLSSLFWYRTNVVKSYIEGNPDPTDELVEQWTPVLESEIAECQPRLIIAVGRFAARWFLSDSFDDSNIIMDMVHGIPHKWSSKLLDEGSCCVLPVIHPAAGFYDNDMKAVIYYDYEQVARVVECVERGKSIDYRHDEFEGIEDYRDVSGSELAELVSGGDIAEIGLDTEGTPVKPWSIQVSTAPGNGYTLRYSRDDFEVGLNALVELANTDTKFIAHNYMYDLEMCRVMGLDLFDADIIDTMYMAYLLRLEPQGLKPLAFRHCGMKMQSWDEMTSVLGIQRQIQYLELVINTDFPKPDPRLIVENDGTARVTKPWHIHRLAAKILKDIEIGKVDKDGNFTDPVKRWKKVDKVQRRLVEKMLGDMPIGSVGAVFEVDPKRAIWYASRDSDAALRLYYSLKPKVDSSLLQHGMEILPVFEEMQSTGMTASRSAFEQLYEVMGNEKSKIQLRLSARYFNNKPFNPNSPIHVRQLLYKRGLEGDKITGSGEMSTSKDSIEHLRYEDEAISDVFEWREREHVQSAFCAPILDRMPDVEDDESDIYPVRCNIKVTRVHTRRLATSDPNLLAIPTRTDIGRKVRESYVAPDGMMYGAWDLSQIEMRGEAHESGDKFLCELFDEDRDVHTETAARIFEIDINEVDQRIHRRPAKDIGFGVLYGIKGDGLQVYLKKQGIHWSVEKCNEMIDKWFETYPGVREYIERVTRELSKTGIVKDHWGMMRYLPGIWSRFQGERNEAGRIAVNHRIQGLAQGMIQNSIVWLKPRVRELQRQGFDIRWCLEVHDEVILLFEDGLWDMLNELVLEGLTRHCGIQLRVPVLAEGAQGRSWGDLK